MKKKEKLKEVKIPLKKLERIAEYYEIPIVVFFATDDQFPCKTRNEYWKQLASTKFQKLISQLEAIIKELKMDLMWERNEKNTL